MSVGQNSASKGATIAYVRVSSQGQNPARQYEALGDGIDKFFEDRISGKNTERPGLRDLLDWAREGDTVRVASMDRLARNLLDLRQLVETLTSKGVRVEFVKEGLTFSGDETSPMNTLLLNLLGSVAEFERALIAERRDEGIALAKAAGKYKGRKPSLTPEQIAEVRQRLDDGVTLSRIAQDLGVSRQTLYTALKGAGTYAAASAA